MNPHGYILYMAQKLTTELTRIHMTIYCTVFTALSSLAELKKIHMAIYTSH